jgi:hypothetical protein
MPLKSLKGKKHALKVRRRRKLPRLYKLREAQRDEEVLQQQEEPEDEAAEAVASMKEEEGGTDPFEHYPENPPEAGPYLVNTDEMVLCLLSLGLKTYILTMSDNIRAATTTVSRTAEMLRYFHICLDGAVIIACIMSLDATKLLAYVKHLRDNQDRSNSTVYNTLIDIKTAYEWVVIFHAPAHIVSGFYVAMQIHFKKQLKVYRKKKKADSVKIKLHTSLLYISTYSLNIFAGRI